MGAALGTQGGALFLNSAFQRQSRNTTFIKEHIRLPTSLLLRKAVLSFNMSNLEEVPTTTSTSRPEDIEDSTPDGEPVSEKKPTSPEPSQIQAPVSTLTLYTLFPAVCFTTFLFTLNASIVATVSAYSEPSSTLYKF